MGDKIIGQFNVLWRRICDYADELGAEQWEDMEEAFNELKDMVKSIRPKRSHEELIRELDNDPETIAWKVWTLADITSHTEEMMERNSDFKAEMDNKNLTPEDVTEAAHEVSWNYLSDCNDGDWLALEQGIEEIVSRFKV